MTPETPRYCQFHAARVRTDAGFVVVEPAAGGARYRLSTREHTLAQLFDGARDADARLREAGDASRDELDTLARDLAEAGLLQAGKDEALPVSPQVLSQPLPAQQQADYDSLPPSQSPGSLSGAGLPGTLGGSGDRRRGEALQGTKVPVGGLLWLGHLFDASNRHWLPRVLVWALAAGALFAFWAVRQDAARDALNLLSPFRLLFTLVPGAILISLIAALARAAAVRRWSQEMPDLRLRLAFWIFPRFETDTEGAAERSELRGRLQIIGSGLQATLLIFVLCAYGWLMARHMGTFLPSFLLGVAVLAAAGFLLRLNPLVRREGYLLLAHRLDVPDLREQAWMAVFGFHRPWASQSPPPMGRLRLFAALVVLYLVVVVTLIVLFPGRWLGVAYGGTGVALFLAVMLVAAFMQYRLARSQRETLTSSWGDPKRQWNAPSRRTWVLLIVVALLALFPYRYEASGRLVVLPQERVDVRALTPGDVREVFVAEGDIVEAGQDLARLASGRELAQVRMSEAAVRRLEAQLALESAGARSEELELARQRVQTARTRYEYAQNEARRAESAYRRSSISEQDHEAARSNAQTRAAELAEAQSNLELVASDARDERIEALEAEVEAEKARLDYNRQQYEDTQLRAPIDGRVVSDRLLFARGTYLDAGDLLATIESTGPLHAEIRVPESQIGEVRIGAPVRVRVWAHPNESLHGEVLHIAPNAEEDSYGKTVRVLVSLDDPEGLLRVELTGQGKIASRRLPAAIVFTRAIARFLFVEVWSWLP